MTPQTTPVRKQADAPLQLHQDSLKPRTDRAADQTDPSWIRPAPGEDKYADVPCTD